MSELAVNETLDVAEETETIRVSNHRYLNVRLPKETHELLSEYCGVAGQTKTVAVDRALRSYCTRQLKQMSESDM